MARAMWKGVLQLGDDSAAVKMYSAIEPQKVHFQLVHGPELTPVSQKVVRKSDGLEVPKGERFKAYPRSNGDLVMLSAQELADVAPEKSRDIELCRFVPRSLLGDQWYDRPYFLGPDGDDEAYFALVRALEQREVEGIARWVMRKKRYVGALQSVDGYLMLITLRRADQVVAVRNVQVPKTRQPDAKELKMAAQLVHMLEGDFAPSEWKDEYRQRVLSLIEAKSRGETYSVETPTRSEAKGGLAEVLEQSLSAAGAQEAKRANRKEKNVA